MSTATHEKKEPLLPPDESFWQRYSPHHEFPLAAMTSFFIHGLVFGVMGLGALGILWYLFQDAGESRKPPSMDVVQISGGGDGFEGLGGEAGLPGTADAKTEAVPDAPAKVEAVPETAADLKDAPRVEFDIPEVGPIEPKTDLDSLLSNLEKDAAIQAKKETPVKKSMKVVSSGTGNQGTGGMSGAGGGPGKGIRGSGLGVGGPGGRKATKAEVYAWRWHFELYGGGKEHVDKYIAMGVTVALRHPNGSLFFIQDLRRRPVELQLGNLDKYKDAVKWQNVSPVSLLNLAKELGLRFEPVQAIMLLPVDREQRMADEELRFARKLGIPVSEIEKTVFDFQLRGGQFEPVVLNMFKR